MYYIRNVADQHELQQELPSSCVSMFRINATPPATRMSSLQYLPIGKSKDYVYGIRVYKVLGIWKGYYRVKEITSFMHETVKRGKK